VRCVSELNKGRGEVVSKAGREVKRGRGWKGKLQTSPIVELRRNTDTRPVLSGKCKVGFAHGKSGGRIGRERLERDEGENDNEIKGESLVNGVS
jgi:hypothetical protein